MFDWGKRDDKVQRKLEEIGNAPAEIQPKVLGKALRALWSFFLGLRWSGSGSIGTLNGVVNAWEKGIRSDALSSLLILRDKRALQNGLLQMHTRHAVKSSV